MQTRISLSTLSLLVMAAINVEQKTSLIALSSVVFDVVCSSCWGGGWFSSLLGLR